MKNPGNKTLQVPSTAMISRLSETGRGKSELEPYLVIVSGSEQGKHFKLHRQQNVFGRDQDADIVVADPKISRRHGVFTIYPDGIVLEDFNSTNGTFVDGKRVAKHRLGPHDRIRVGDTYMRVDYKRHGEALSEQALYQAANTDALTAILNRGAFMIRAEQEFSFCKRNGGRLTIVMCDADHFKRKNDKFGHPAGDHVLKELADILSREMRKEDLLARYGGEEFVMLLRESSETAAEGWAERIRHTVMQHSFVFQGRAIPTTLSIGVCSRQADAAESLQAVIQAADDALYRAKQNGRNRVEIAGP